MTVPLVIEGILVQRKDSYEIESRFKEHTKFKFHRYIFSSSSIPPGSISPCIPMLHQLLGIRTIQTDTEMQPIDHSTCSVDLNSLVYFLAYWPSADRWQSKYTQAFRNRSMIFYRDDFKPLHPKQLEALWSFCDRLCAVITPPLLFEYQLPGRFGYIGQGIKLDEYPFKGHSRERRFWKLACLLERGWRDYCTVDNLNAFFQMYRYDRLLDGDESWREVKSLCDT